MAKTEPTNGLVAWPKEKWPEIDENEEKVRLAVRIPKSLHRRLKMYAATGRGTIQEIVTFLLHDGVPVSTREVSTTRRRKV